MWHGKNIPYQKHHGNQSKYFQMMATCWLGINLTITYDHPCSNQTTTFENMNMEQMWRINDCLYQARQAWKFFKYYKNYLASDDFPPIKTFKRLINKMSTSSESHPSSPDEYPFITTTELSCLLLNHEMNFVVSTTFSSSPLATALLRNCLFVSHNIEHIRQDLTRHQLEQQSLFDILGHSTPFRDTITPILFDFRRCQRQVSHVNPPSTFHSTLHHSTSEDTDLIWPIIIQERSNSDDSILSYYTVAHADSGTRENPIDVDQLLDLPPSPPRIPIYSPSHMQSAPVTAPCTMCQRCGHTSIQCVWYGLGICSYCWEVRHTQHPCDELRRDQLQFNPHLKYCLTCQQSGHTSSHCNTLPSYCWNSSSLVSLKASGGVMLHFLHSIVAICYRCYLLSSAIVIIILFLLSVIDNHYA